jgi:radical SAM protein with 4Fe4S-binding SPASM domain
MPVRGAETPPLPRRIQLEVTRSCNLRCTMCLVSYRPVPNRTDGSMDLETFTRIVDELPELESIQLQGLGEPLLAPDLFAMIAYATERGVRVGFNTNAMLLTPARGERLIRAGLGWLHVSIDGATAETYEAIRGGGRFDRVCANVSAFAETKRRLDATNLELELVFVAMRGNVAELPRLVRMAAGWGIDRIHVQNLSHSFEDTDGLAGYREIQRFTSAEALWSARDRSHAREAIDRACDEAARLGVRLRVPKLAEADGAPRRRRPGTPGCFWPWEQTYIHHDGRVQPCCMIMGEDRAIVGDAKADGLAAVWEGETYKRFRERLLGADPPEVCVGCSLYRGVF